MLPQSVFTLNAARIFVAANSLRRLGNLSFYCDDALRYSRNYPILTKVAEPEDNETESGTQPVLNYKKHFRR